MTLFIIAVVELERIGEIMLPVEVLVHFNDGNEIRKRGMVKAVLKILHIQEKKDSNGLKLILNIK